MRSMHLMLSSSELTKFTSHIVAAETNNIQKKAPVSHARLVRVCVPSRHCLTNAPSVPESNYTEKHYYASRERHNTFFYI